MGLSTIPPSTLPTTLYASPSLPPRISGGHGCPLSSIRSQQAFDFAEEPSEPGRSSDSLADDLSDTAVVRANAAALVMGAGARDTGAIGEVRPTLPLPSPRSSPSQLPSLTPSPSGAAAWNVRWVEGGSGGLPASLRRRAAELVRGRSGRSLRRGRH